MLEAFHATNDTDRAFMTARGLDHLVIGVRDLDRAGALYQRLGFQVGKRNLHPWGTENRIVQFPGAFLELLAVGEGKTIDRKSVV